VEKDKANGKDKHAEKIMRIMIWQATLLVGDTLPILGVNVRIAPFLQTFTT